MRDLIRQNLKEMKRYPEGMNPIPKKMVSAIKGKNIFLSS
jgi:hypothetical protein